MGKHSVAEAKSQLSALIDRALAGDEVIITRHGTAVVELKPVGNGLKRFTPEGLHWLDANRVVPQHPLEQSAADLIGRMRDEDWR